MKKKILKSAGLLIILLLLGVLFFFPVYWTIITSFKTKAQVFVEQPILWIDTLYLDNYIEIFRKSYVATFFSNSMLVAVSTTVISLALATMAGFYTVYHRLRAVQVPFQGKQNHQEQCNRSPDDSGSGLHDPVLHHLQQDSSAGYDDRTHYGIHIICAASGDLAVHQLLL